MLRRTATVAAPSFKLSLNGVETPFDKAEVRFGRTSDNEVVVLDPAASRSHARIVAGDAGFTIEDLGSGNGTKLNGVKLTAPSALQHGDTITIGDTVYTFHGPPPVDQTMLQPPPGLDPAADPNATLIKPLGPAPAPEPVDPNATLIKPLGEPVRPAVADSTAEVPGPAQLAQRPAADVADLETRDVKRDAMTAAERLRERREAQKTALGRLRYGWGQLPKAARWAIGAGSTTAVLALAAAVVVSNLPEQKNLPPEPGQLTSGPLVEASFGEGEGVMYRRPDMKIFSFHAAGATRLVGVLHYQAKDVSKDEVVVSLNGVNLGAVPADTLDTANRELELVLPADHVKKGELNQLVFDNTRNPPGDESWQVWNVRLELVALPNLTADETIAAVTEDMERARTFYDQREIGPENLFRAWKDYRDAWLKLESVSPRPEGLYVEARSRQREISQELDTRCSAVQLDAVKLLNARRPDYQLARDTLTEALRYFPTKEHRCHALIRALLEDVGGPT